MGATWAIVLAGGVGTRFWPRSRRTRPKQVLAIEGDRTLLRATVDRIAPIVPRERVLVVTGREMEHAVRAALPDLDPGAFLVEPTGRNTAPALALALVEVERRGGDAIIALPSDHRIADERAFRAIVAAAVEASRRTGALVLLGQQPTRPETAYGWIVAGAPVVEVDGRPFLGVARFVEKPARPIAEGLLADGALWNGGMFAWTTSALREALRATLPGTLSAVERGDWASTDAISIDHGVLERWDRRLVVRCDFGWSDLGAWPAMEDLYPAVEGGVARAEDVVAVDSSGNVVDAGGRVVALVGVHDLVIVEADGVLLVADKRRIGELPDVLAALRARGRDDLV